MPGKPREVLVESLVLFYKLAKWMLAVGMDLDLERVGGMSVGDRRLETVGMEGWMTQVSGGTDSDRWEPMVSEEKVGQGDCTT